jgi:hypothetical protein
MVAGAAALLFGWIALTVPMISASAPAILTIACAVLAFYAWPRTEPPAS